MGLQEWQSVVSIVVGSVGVIVLLIGVGKGWASLTQASAKLTAVHTRLDKVVSEQQAMRLNLVQIRTFLSVHPTLRFRLPEAAPPQSVQQDVFKPEDLDP